MAMLVDENRIGYPVIIIMVNDLKEETMDWFNRRKNSVLI